MTPYYQDDAVTIYHGDALEILPTIKKKVSAVVTDPPYMIGAVSAGSIASKAGTWGDMMNSSRWFTTWYREVGRLIGDDGCFWTFLNWRSVPVVLKAAIDAEMPVTSMAVWDKRWIGPGGVQGLRPSYELIALLAGANFAIKDRGAADVIAHKVGSYKPHGHPAEKPEGIVSRLLALSSLTADDLVLDPFMGSGTTLRAAKTLGISAIGVESEERYCEIAARRMGQEVLFS